jgi:TP901-1 family phage major tail protein
MTAQAGRDMLLKLDQTGSGSFLTVAGLRTRGLALNAATIDTTDQESAGHWRELLSGGGVKRAALSGAGVFKDQASDAAIRSLFFAGTIRDWQLVIPDFGIVEGPFQITALEFAADHAGEVTFEIALESAGLISFESLGG